ncbi:uncharacterized protein LOC128132569 [Lactuca sativa]|uniref:uncharacterized protein LOC128132569 n=1 Tax=Lactuca sativa TaxID=4236 RepID=UPI0022AEE963|nr:uncharacterized protein LOC128132569 [Lactuca sativa]
MTYHMSKEEITLSKLQGLLRTTESGLKGKSVESTPAASAQVLAIGHGKGKNMKSPSKNHKGKSHDGSSSNGSKGKTGSATPLSDPKETTCFYCHETGHWKRSFPKYLQDIKDGR